MVLAGVGGRTIEQAREFICIDELEIWQAYIAKNGPLAVQRRLEYTAAQLAMILVNANRDPKSKPLGLDTFLLWQDRAEPEPDEDDDDDAVMHRVMREIARVARPDDDATDGGSPRKRLWTRKVSAV